MARKGRRTIAESEELAVHRGLVVRHVGSKRQRDTCVGRTVQSGEIALCHARQRAIERKAFEVFKVDDIDDINSVMAYGFLRQECYALFAIRIMKVDSVEPSAPSHTRCGDYAFVFRTFDARQGAGRKTITAQSLRFAGEYLECPDIRHAPELRPIGIVAVQAESRITTGRHADHTAATIRKVVAQRLAAPPGL